MAKFLKPALRLSLTSSGWGTKEQVPNALVLGSLNQSRVIEPGSTLSHQGGATQSSADNVDRKGDRVRLSRQSQPRDKRRVDAPIRTSTYDLWMNPAKHGASWNLKCMDHLKETRK